MADIKTWVTTNKARQKLAKSHVDGSPVPKIIMAGWGTGGVDTDGNVLEPDALLSVVPEEIIRNNIISAQISSDGLSAIFSMELNPGEEGVLNKKISTVGLYDQEGDLICIKNFAAKEMDVDTKISIQCEEEF